MFSISDAASAYFLSAERCEEFRPLEEGKSQMLLSPAVTNRAFSVELYVKAILEKENSEARGHNLYELFQKLSEPVQTEIIRITGIDGEEFRTEIEENSNLFVDWRYLYEKENEDVRISWQFLQHLSIAVRSVYESTYDT